jgi:hypothetical protein
MAALLHDSSPITAIESSMDKDGQATYVVTYLVDCDPDDGPEIIRQCPGLPKPGDYYSVDNDRNNYAFCYWADQIKKWSPENEPATQYKVTKTFSTKAENTEHCRPNAAEDPLIELPKISGSQQKYTEEAVIDRFGRAITYSSWERIRGPQNEWDRNRTSIKIQQNVASFYYGVQLPSSMLDCVNAFPLWGLPVRTIKLSTAAWEKKYYGPCIPYYSRTLDFDIRYTLLDSGTYETWDRFILDESSKVLMGKWSGSGSTLTWVPQFQVAGMTGTPDPNNPAHFMKCADVTGNLQKMVLNGAGVPANVMAVNDSIQVWMSIVAGNIAFPLSNGSKWIAAATPVDTWTTIFNGNAASFPRGSIFTDFVNNKKYIAIQTVKGNDINSNPSQDLNGNWLQLPSVSSAGVYSAATTYGLGDYVTSPTFSGGAGYIFVSKYPGADFAQLGIPLAL